MLEASQVWSVNALLNEYPEYQAEFVKLQTTRAAIQNSLPTSEQTSALPDGQALWANIAGQLQADVQTEPSAYSPEWLSAYADGEISSQSDEFERFERQLSQNLEANELLAQLQQISETVKQFGYRQENQCTFEQSATIMATFLAEQAPAASKPVAHTEKLTDSSIDPQWELLSSFIDQALSPREMIQVTLQIESSELTRSHLLQFNQISEGIQRISQQLQAQAPDLWPTVQDRLKKMQAQQKEADRDRPKRLHWAKRATIPVAAAILLIVLSLPNLHIPGLSPTATVEANWASPSATPTLNNQSSPSTQGRELASIPSTMTEGRHLRASALATQAPMLDEESAPATSPIESTPAATTAPLRPILEPAPAMANANLESASSGARLQSDTMSTRGKAPSSDTYLFEALSKHMPEEDISNILGK